MTYYRGPTIDHTLLSPSGKASKRARQNALKREAARLFPPGFWTDNTPTAEKGRAEKLAQLQSRAEMLRGFVARGYRPRLHKRELAKCEHEIRQLEG